jgi:hypothetical protein
MRHNYYRHERLNLTLHGARYPENVYSCLAIKIFCEFMIPEVFYYNNFTAALNTLLGNDRETSNYTTATDKQRIRKKACFHGNERTQQQWKRRFLRGPCCGVIIRTSWQLQSIHATKLCRKQEEVIQNHESEHIRGIEQGEARHRKYKRLKLGGGQAYDR